MPLIAAEKVSEALLALEGTVIEDLSIPLPGDLRDISKAAALVSGVVEDRIPEPTGAQPFLNSDLLPALTDGAFGRRPSTASRRRGARGRCGRAGEGRERG